MCIIGKILALTGKIIFCTPGYTSIIHKYKYYIKVSKLFFLFLRPLIYANFGFKHTIFESNAYEVC